MSFVRGNLLVQQVVGSRQRLLNSAVRSQANKNNPLNNLLHGQQHQQTRQMGGVVSKFMENVKKGFAEDKQATEDLEAVKKGSKESIDAIKKGAEFTKEKVAPIGEAASKVVEGAGEVGSKVASNKYVQKTAEGTKAVLGKTAEVGGKVGDRLSKTSGYKAAAATGNFLKTELVDDSVLAQQKYHPYQKPSQDLHADVLKKSKGISDVVVDENTEATDVVLHSKSRWEVEWANFKENNATLQKAYEWQMKYDESDSLVVRILRSFSDKFAEIKEAIGGGSDQQDVLAEIHRMDPTFQREVFIEEVHSKLIPLLIEAYYKQDVELLENWCAEHTWGIIKHIYQNQKDLGATVHCEVQSINHVDIFNAVQMEQGPVLNVTAMVQQICYSTDAKGEIIDGSKDQVEEVLYIIAFCRDESLQQVGSWRIMDFSMHMRRPVI